MLNNLSLNEEKYDNENGGDKMILEDINQNSNINNNSSISNLPLLERIKKNIILINISEILNINKPIKRKVMYAKDFDSSDNEEDSSLYKNKKKVG